VAAEGIYWAAHHPHRELRIGSPTVGAVVGNKIAPGILDRYLAKTGYDSQQTSEPVDADRPDNLFEPAPGDWGAHGVFTDRATTRQPAVVGGNPSPLAGVVERRRGGTCILADPRGEVKTLLIFVYCSLGPSDHGFGILLSHAEWGHGGAQGLPEFPNSSGQQFHHFGIRSRGIAANPGRLERPVLHRRGGLKPESCAVQPFAAIRFALVVARGMALSTHGNVLDYVFSAGDESFGRLLRAASAGASIRRLTMKRRE
jgi:hypothetical protein